MSTNEMGKLVEEIAIDVKSIYLLGDMKLVPEEIPAEIARRLIARIGKAYVDGLPLPGEVGRIIFRTRYASELLGEGLTLVNNDTIIALRPEEASKLDGETE